MSGTAFSKQTVKAQKLPSSFVGNLQDSLTHSLNELGTNFDLLNGEIRPVNSRIESKQDWVV